MYGDDSANVSTLGTCGRVIRTSRDRLSLMLVPDDFNEFTSEFVAPRVIFGFVFILRQSLTILPRLAKDFWSSCLSPLSSWEYKQLALWLALEISLNCRSCFKCVWMFSLRGCVCYMWRLEEHERASGTAVMDAHSHHHMGLGAQPRFLTRHQAL